MLSPLKGETIEELAKVFELLIGEALRVKIIVDFLS